MQYFYLYITGATYRYAPQIYPLSARTNAFRASTSFTAGAVSNLLLRSIPASMGWSKSFTRCTSSIICRR